MFTTLSRLLRWHLPIALPETEALEPSEQAPTPTQIGIRAYILAIKYHEDATPAIKAICNGLIKYWETGLPVYRGPKVNMKLLAEYEQYREIHKDHIGKFLWTTEEWQALSCAYLHQNEIEQMIQTDEVSKWKESF